MRVALWTYGTRGDAEPMVALAVRLQTLGVDTTLYAPRDFAALADRAGVPMVPAGGSVRTLATATPADLFANQFDAAAALIPVEADVLVITGMMPAAAGARSVAERAGITSVYATFQQLMLPSPHQPPLLYPGRPFPPERPDAAKVNAFFAQGLNRFRALLTLAPVGDVRDYVRTDVLGDPLLATDPTLDPWHPTPAVDAVQTGAWILPDPRPLSAELEAFLNAGAPPVYVGFGSMPVPPDLARATIAAIRAHGRRVIVGRGWAGLAANGAYDAIAIGEVNQQALFRRVAAVIHHGGGGTTMTAARAGTPQVVIPLAADQPYWAARVAELGIGYAHDGAVPTEQTVADALDNAVQTRATAADLAGIIRDDGVTVAADLLLRA